MKYLRQFLIILLITFAGEVLKYLIPLPVPASIYGLIILFLLLSTGVVKVGMVKDTAAFLIEIMPLMFIPAAVGLIDSWDALKPIWVQMSVGRQPQDKLQAYYDAIDVLLMPSRSEGFGLTAVEGMARGCVPVVSDTGGLPEVLGDSECGCLHRLEDADDMAAKILAATADLNRMSTASIRRAADFSYEKYQQQIAELYSRLDSAKICRL